MELWNSALLKGVFCSTICNIIFIASNKLIIKYSLSGNNINFFKGSIQTILFFLILIIKNCLVKEETSRENEEDMVEQEEMLGDNDNRNSMKIINIKVFLNQGQKVMWLLLFGVCFGLVFLSFNIGSKEIPFSYFVTIIATTPIFALLFSRCILKLKITFLKILTCLSLILGICMVMYKGLGYETNTEKQSTNSTIDNYVGVSPDNSTYGLFNCTEKVNGSNSEHNKSKRYQRIYLGIISAFVFAILGGLANVIPAKCREVSWYVMMLYAGFGSLFFSTLTNFLPIFKLTIFGSGYSYSYTKIIVEITLGFFGMMANGLLILANRLSSPTINSVVRRSEIILVLIYDVIWFKEYPDVIEGCGYVVVLISVIIMTFADQIQESILKLKNQHLTSQEV